MDNKKIIPITRINKSYKLYGLYCPYSDELKYIGITTGLLSSRLSGHLRNPTNGKIALWFKELKNNKTFPTIKLIREYETYENLLLGEIDEIKKNRENKIRLFNVADGGDINPMFGKTHSEEAKLKISKTHKGRKLTEEQKKIKKELLLKLWSNEEWSNAVKEKMSKNMKGNKHLLGYKHTEEAKQKMSETHKGHKYNVGNKHSEETKKIMSYNNSGVNNPMFGRRLTEETLKKRSEKVIEKGIFKGKNNPNFKYDIKKYDLIRYFIDSNMKIDEISKIYGCHRTVISNNLKKYNIKKEPTNKYNLNINNILAHKNNGLSLVEIGKIFGCSNKIIHKFIKKHKNGKQ